MTDTQQRATAAADAFEEYFRIANENATLIGRTYTGADIMRMNEHIAERRRCVIAEAGANRRAVNMLRELRPCLHVAPGAVTRAVEEIDAHAHGDLPCWMRDAAKVLRPWIAAGCPNAEAKPTLPPELVKMLRRAGQLTDKQRKHARDLFAQAGYVDGTAQIRAWRGAAPHTETTDLHKTLNVSMRHASTTRNKLGWPAPRAGKVKHR